MMPTKEQWQEIEQQLNRWMDPVYLLCDGYLVQYRLARVSTNKLEIACYVNGWLKGSWLTGLVKSPDEFCEEGRRFFRHRKRQRWSAKELKFWEKFYGKRECRKRGFYDPRYSVAVTWLKPGPLIRHLKKYNQSIEVLDSETYQQRIALLPAEEDASA